ncbi:MAG TPA: FHA domain-containing protein [Solirubrobacteraceae bacterium]|nr:FHA domain-containing protein [Solirubrobacteraceae bacterium]
MTTLAPVSVALKFGFLAVLYLFVLWVSRSARRDLRGSDATLLAEPGAQSPPIAADATGLYSASSPGADVAHRSPQLVVERAPGHEAGMIYDVDGDLVLGRGEQAEIRLEDPFASSRHARIFEQGNAVVIEDLGSTNGTYLNEEVLQTPRPLHPGDRVRIGDSEFTFEVD